MQERPWHRHYDYSVPETIRYPRLPVADLLQIPANAYPDKAATYFYGSELTFWELRQQVLRMANALGAMGVSKGDRVGLHLPNCPQYVICYYAVLSLGAIVVNMNPLYTPAELREIAGQTGMATLITFDMALAEVKSFHKDVSISCIIVTRVTDYISGIPRSTAKDFDLGEAWHHFSEVLEGCTDTRRPRVEIAPEDAAMIQFTGGTTGVPKGAVLTHGNVVASSMIATLWGGESLIPPERRFVMAIIPYFHVYGNICVINWSILNCATQIVVPRFDIDELLGIMANFKEIMYFPSVPTMINAIINHPKAQEMELGRKLGMLNSGAAPMPQEMIDQVKDMGIYFSEGWGMSETTSMGITNPVLGIKKVGSIGIPIPDTDVKLVDIADGVTEVSPGEPGEIIIKGPTVMKEYWNNPEETANQLKDGWLYTGDIAVQDEDDYFFIVDRKKDMIIAGGFNIYPRDIDEVLYQHPKIVDAVTIGVPDEYRGETVKAFIVLKEGETASEEEIITFCREKLTAYKVPKLIEFRNELPKSAVGKVLRKILREEEIAKKK